ncbi:MAG TPA: MTH1187 family thiamine-binding protein [bacterium]|nr:MTH1187 family thiamine-binding protein [bacterium]
MLAVFTIIPIGGDESVSPVVAKMIEAVDASGLDYKLTAMGTIIEGNWDDVMAVIKKCHNIVRRGSARVSTSITIDDRKGAKKRLSGKIESVRQKVKRDIKT